MPAASARESFLSSIGCLFRITVSKPYSLHMRAYRNASEPVPMTKALLSVRVECLLWNMALLETTLKTSKAFITFFVGSVRTATSSMDGSLTLTR